MQEAERQDLKILMTIAILNKRTAALISHALKDLDKELTLDLIDIPMTTDQGKALLSTYRLDPENLPYENQ